MRAAGGKYTFPPEVKQSLEAYLSAKAEFKAEHPEASSSSIKENEALAALYRLYEGKKSAFLQKRGVGAASMEASPAPEGEEEVEEEPKKASSPIRSREKGVRKSGEPAEKHGSARNFSALVSKN
jgi:hypothetical protein